ncbi:MAG TPA: DUF2934 domain-containing protein [Kofleriaceae bacterium]
MATKKKKKVPAASTLNARKTEAPLLVTRPIEEPTLVVPVEIERIEIMRLAFSKYVARDYAHGHAVADWLAAEAELRAAKN